MKRKNGSARDDVTREGRTKKKLYHKPKLIEHGSVTQLTAGMNGSNFDPGQSGSTKLGT